MEIKLYEMFCTDTLRHRETARKIIESLPKDTTSVTINFDHIDFVSRSFLHELLTGLCNQNFDVTNANDEVTQMVSIIQKNRSAYTVKCQHTAMGF